MQKEKTPRNDKYLAWIRTRPCVATGITGQDIVAHHVRLNNGGGISLKPSDYRTIPLTNSFHVELHNRGEADFFAYYSIDPDAHILSNLCIYLMEMGQSKEAIKALEGCMEYYSDK